MAGRSSKIPIIDKLVIKRSRHEKQFAYLDNERDIRVEAVRHDGAEWIFVLHGGHGVASINIPAQAADLLSEFIEKIRGIPEGA